MSKAGLSKILPTTPTQGEEGSRLLPVPHSSEAKGLNEKEVIFKWNLLDLQHKYFNLGGTCQKWFVTLFLKLHEISKLTRGELISGRYASLRPHSHKKLDKLSAFPSYQIEPNQFRQIRLSKGRGGIHGILINEFFFVIWLDPYHNLYPDEKYGGLRTLEAEGECCGFNKDFVDSLHCEIARLNGELEAAEALLSEAEEREVAYTKELK